jgi:Glycosyl transferases group 1/Glycosyl transferase 4-like domain
MRLLFVADGRSPIALNWIAHFVDAGHSVHLVSTYACTPDLALTSLETIPVAFSQAAAMVGPTTAASERDGLRRMAPVGLRTTLRQWLGPLSLPGAAQRLREIINRLKPDLVHAMRIPYEGMLAGMALAEEKALPLLVSVWGNDFTLHARSSPFLARRTREALRRANALHTDCQQDQRLAHDWGFDPGKPSVVLPGGGGVQLDVFYPVPGTEGAYPPTLINPRGFRAYVCNQAFFQAIPLVLASHPQARFLCPSMAAEQQAHRWVKQLGIIGQVELLPRQTRPAMADLFRRSTVAVSPSTHDGTPNTLLEALACGCFPVVGDIESLREWIDPGVNGLLVDPNDPRALAQAMVAALDQPELRLSARQYNSRLVAERADYRKVMAAAEAFYQEIT